MGAPVVSASSPSVIQTREKSGLSIVGTRCGINGKGGTLSGAGNESRIKHWLPYGAKSIAAVYAGFSQSGTTPVKEVPFPLGQGYYVVSAVPTVGGASYAVGDIIPGTSGTETNAPLFCVDSVTAGAVTALSVLDPGMLSAVPAAALATTHNSGSGNDALTVTVTCKATGYCLNVGLEQVWGTQTAYSTSTLTGVRQFTKGTTWNGGQSNLYLDSGGLLVTDLLQVNLAAAATIGTRIWTNGNLLPVGRVLSGSAGANEDSHATENKAASVPFGGTMPTHASPANGFQPIALLGEPQTPGPTIAIIGDSISYGIISTGSASTTADTPDATTLAVGWVEKSIANQVPFINLASSGERLTDWLAQTSSTTGKQIHLNLLQLANPSHILLCLGTNDAEGGAASAATIEANFLALCDLLMGTGAKEIWAPTLCPNTTSSDNWVTTGNQTLTAASTAIAAFNVWLVGGGASAHGVTRVIDNRALIETSVGSGIWQAATTNDGVHPNATLVATLVTANTALFAPGNINL